MHAHGFVSYSTGGIKHNILHYEEDFNLLIVKSHPVQCSEHKREKSVKTLMH